MQCLFKWVPRIDNPKACPKCKRYDWNEKAKGGKRQNGKEKK